jgi:fumarylacetoacetate (FAA) hydrolase family protein
VQSELLFRKPAIHGNKSGDAARPSSLMTGTGIVPPDSFTLKSGDQIRITVEPIGTLVNEVA